MRNLQRGQTILTCHRVGVVGGDRYPPRKGMSFQAAPWGLGELSLDGRLIPGSARLPRCDGSCKKTAAALRLPRRSGASRLGGPMQQDRCCGLGAVVRHFTDSPPPAPPGEGDTKAQPFTPARLVQRARNAPKCVVIRGAAGATYRCSSARSGSANPCGHGASIPAPPSRHKGA